MQAYSTPITPPPTTIIVLGRCSSFSSPSDAKTVLSSNGTLAGRAGPRAGGDDELVGAEQLEIVRPVDVKQTLSSSNCASPPDQLDAVAVEVVADELPARGG